MRTIVKSRKQLSGRISLPVLGEVLVVLERKEREGVVTDDDYDAMMWELWQLIKRGEVGLYGIGGGANVYTKADRIVRECDVNATDALIIACMLVDEQAHALYTADGQLHENHPLRRYVVERHDSKSLKDPSDLL